MPYQPRYLNDRDLPERLARARQRKALCFQHPEPAYDRSVVTRMQATEAADEFGMVRVFVFAQGRCVAVSVDEAARLALAGQASIEQWPLSDAQYYQGGPNV